MAILYHTAKLKSANSVKNVVWGKTAKLNDRQYFRLYSIHKSIYRKLVAVLKKFVFVDESIEEIDVEGNSSDSETSDSSPRQLCDPETEEPQYIIISSGEESIMEEENLIKQGV